MEDWLKYLVCFILGWIIARMMGEGFSVGCLESPPKDLSQIKSEHKKSAIKSLNKIIEMDPDELLELHTHAKSKLDHPEIKKVLNKASQLLKIDAKEKIKNINLTTGVINEIKQIANHLINKLQDRDSFSVGGQLDGELALLLMMYFLVGGACGENEDTYVTCMFFLLLIGFGSGGGFEPVTPEPPPPPPPPGISCDTEKGKICKTEFWDKPAYGISATWGLDTDCYDCPDRVDCSTDKSLQWCFCNNKSQTIGRKQTYCDEWS